MKISKSISSTISKYFSNLFNKSFFKEPLPFHFNVLKPGFVPDTIERPDYMKVKDFNYDNKSYAIHKTQKDIDNHRKSCRITADVLQKIYDYSNKIGFSTTEEIDEMVHKIIISHKAYPTAIGYMGFPKSVCTSVNESKNSYIILIYNSCCTWNS